MKPTSVPNRVDRVIVHQFDPARPSPGGIDTCIRGILRYATPSQTIAVVGVDTGVDVPGRRLGQWEEHDLGGGSFSFLPVAALDPADQNRRVPHSVRLVRGVLQNWRRIPSSSTIQAHRADTAAALSFITSRPMTYFIHTQESGLTGSTSDSMWKNAGSIHSALERRVSRRAKSIAVFNPDYASVVGQWNSRAQSFPTWYDPDLLTEPRERKERSILWVGRLEEPKDPALALRVLRQLNGLEPGWTLDLVGSGTLLEQVREAAEGMENQVTIHGRLAPREVAELMGRNDVFLMTSHPGYEGFPRVLVEAMASGLRPVVTQGSDTGGLISNASTGYLTSRDPLEIARSVLRSQDLNRDQIKGVVWEFSAPKVVSAIYGTKEQP